MKRLEKLVIEKKFIIEFIMTVFTLFFAILSVFYANGRDIAYFAACDKTSTSVNCAVGLSLIQVDGILHTSYSLYVIFLSLLIIILFILKFDRRVIHSPYYIFLQAVVWLSLVASLTAPVSTLQSLQSNVQYNFWGYAALGGIAAITSVLVAFGFLIGGYITIIERLGFSRKDIFVNWNKVSGNNKAVVIAFSGLIIGNILILLGLFLFPYSGIGTLYMSDSLVLSLVFSVLVIFGYMLVYLYLLKLYLYSDFQWTGENARAQNSLIIGLIIVFQLVQLIPIISLAYYINVINGVFYYFNNILIIVFPVFFYGILPLFIIGEIICIVSIIYLIFLRSKNLRLDVQVSNVAKEATH